MRLVLAAVLALTAPVVALAQTPDPTGHWEGSISAPFGEIPIALDIARKEGALIALYSRSDGAVAGFPLSNPQQEGTALKLTLEANGGGTFNGTLEGTTYHGLFNASAGSVPFALTRTGQARMPTITASRAVSAALEGTWIAGASLGGERLTLTMTLKNNADGTVAAAIADDHGVFVPITIAQDGARVAIEVPAAHSSFTGTLTSNGSVVEGTYVEGSLKAPLAFAKQR
jgi:hypothetical protein